MLFDLSETQLEHAEKLLGVRFPEPYRDAMLRRNGGALNVEGEVWELIPIRDDRSEQRLSRTCEDVLGWTDQFRMWRTWPKGAISIAINGVGDALLFLKQNAEIHTEVGSHRPLAICQAHSSAAFSQSRQTLGFLGFLGWASLMLTEAALGALSGWGLAAQDRPPPRDVEQALERDSHIGERRRRQQLPRSR